MPCPGECRPHNFGLDHSTPVDFVEPQFGGPSLWYIVYRVAMTTYFCFMTVHNILMFGSYLKWFVYMAHWCLLVITTSTILQVVCVVRHYLRIKSHGCDKDSQKMRVIFQVIWVMQNIIYSSAPIVTIFYWDLFYQGTGLDLVNTNTHIANILYCVCELVITAIPVRFLHFYQAQVYATVYILFTLVYWKAGGTGVHGKSYVYSVFDYDNRPLAAFLWYCAFVVFGFLLHFFAFTIAFVRRLLGVRYARRRKILPTTDAGVDSQPM